MYKYNHGLRKYNLLSNIQLKVQLNTPRKPLSVPILLAFGLFEMQKSIVVIGLKEGVVTLNWRLASFHLAEQALLHKHLSIS